MDRAETTKPRFRPTRSGRLEKPMTRVSGEAEHAHAAVLAPAGGPGRRGVGDAGLPESDPAEHPAQVAVRLAHRPERLERAAVDEPEIAGGGGHVDLGQPAQHAVEPARGQILEAALALPLLHDCVDDLVARLPARDELGDDLRRMLEVSVHRHHGLAAREVEARSQRDLMPEPAREAGDLEARVPRVELDGEAVGAVGRAVVDEHDLPGSLQAVEDGGEPRGERGQDLLLVPERDDHGKTGGVALHRAEGSGASRRLDPGRPTGTRRLAA